MKKVIVISTSLRTGSNSDMLANQFIEGPRLQGMKWKRFHSQKRTSSFVKAVWLVRNWANVSSRMMQTTLCRKC